MGSRGEVRVLVVVVGSVLKIFHPGRIRSFGVFFFFFFSEDDGKCRDSSRFGSSSLYLLVFKASFWEATNLIWGQKIHGSIAGNWWLTQIFCWNF